MEYLNGCKQTGAQHTEPFKTSKLTAKRESLMGAVFYVGDAIKVMNKLPEKSVDLVLSSPPFLALRSYLPSDHPDKALEGGSQATPGAYIDWLIDVVEACARVLAPHGSMCIELGDTYAGSGGAGGDYNDGSLREGQPKFKGSAKFARHEGRDEWEAAHPISRVSGTRGSPGGTGWPLAKSLSLIPELFRLTLVYGTNPLTGRQTDRWRCRNVIRWVRPNPPVGALGDKFRPATSELMVFCKSAKRYFDLDAVREPLSERALSEVANGGVKGGESYRSALDGGYDPSRVRLPATGGGAPPLDWSTGLGARIDSAVRDAWDRAKYDQPDLFESNYGKEQVETVGQKIVREFVAAALLDGGDAVIQPPGGYLGAHYAVWGPVLLPPFIKAMSPERVCRVCGEPSRRIIETERLFDGLPTDMATVPRRSGQAVHGVSNNRITMRREDQGWTNCSHNDWRPGLVLDPFVGSGTTLAVATGHGRDAIGIDLDERNYELALQRVGPLVLEKGEVAA